jgi:hypothetical protein
MNELDYKPFRSEKLSNPIHEQHRHPEGIRPGYPKDLCARFTLELPKSADSFGTKLNA